MHAWNLKTDQDLGQVTKKKMPAVFGEICSKRSAAIHSSPPQIRKLPISGPSDGWLEVVLKDMILQHVAREARRTQLRFLPTGHRDVFA